MGKPRCIERVQYGQQPRRPIPGGRPCTLPQYNETKLCAAHYGVLQRWLMFKWDSALWDSSYPFPLALPEVMWIPSNQVAVHG